MTTRPDHSLAAVQCSRCKLSSNVLADGLCFKCVKPDPKPRTTYTKPRQGSH